MNDIIRKRRSVRKYEKTQLDSSMLDKISEKIKTLTPLHSDVECHVEIVEKTKGPFNIKAPHYLVFLGEKNERSYENAGFIGQQLDLFFSENGLGACWLGVAKPDEKPESGDRCIVSMSFGLPAEPLYREASEFKRKRLSEISEGVDERLEAARLAPSGMNRQNWFFIADEGKIHCYFKKPGPLMESMLKRLCCIDLGIAIYHIAAESENFSFSKLEDAPVKRGFTYAGTVLG